jgi:predicted membrane protein (TIGR00267 family)
MSREELGIDPEELGGSPWSAAGASFVLFALGAIVPVLPFFFGSRPAATWMSVFVSSAALFLIGGGITLFTGRPWITTAVRQVVFGLGAAAVTFAIGRALGAIAT